MSQSPAPGADLAESLARWREAWRIRRAHPKWAVLWVAPARQYQAFRLSRRRRDAVLAAATPEDLAAQIEHAEQAAHRPPGPHWPQKQRPFMTDAHSSTAALAPAPMTAARPCNDEIILATPSRRGDRPA